MEGLKERRPHSVRLLILVVAILGVIACGREGPLQSSETHVADLLISESPVFDFGNVEIGSYADHEFTVINIGQKEARKLTGEFYLSLHFNFVGGKFPGKGGTCKKKLDSGQMCSIVVRFEPQFAGDCEAAIQLSYFDGQTHQTTTLPTLKGRGTGEVISE